MSDWLYQIRIKVSEKLSKDLRNVNGSRLAKEINKIALSNVNSSAKLFSDKSGSALSSLTKRRLDHFNIDMHFEEEVEIKSEDGESKILKADYVLGFFGLIMQLGPISEWGLNLDKKVIPVNTENFETNKKGIFAIGDICTYPGKLKLILSGFHEGALAARGCFKYARPDEKLRFEFTTTSKAAQERLGVKK